MKFTRLGVAIDSIVERMDEENLIRLLKQLSDKLDVISTSRVLRSHDVVVAWAGDLKEEREAEYYPEHIDS